MHARSVVVIRSGVLAFGMLLKENASPLFENSHYVQFKYFVISAENYFVRVKQHF